MTFHMVFSLVLSTDDYIFNLYGKSGMRIFSLVISRKPSSSPNLSLVQICKILEPSAVCCSGGSEDCFHGYSRIF